MTRGLSVAQKTAAAAEQVARTVAVELDFPDGFARFHGGHDTITIGGNAFLGVGQLGSISVAEESAELRAYGLVVKLSGVPRDAVAYALGQAYQGRKGTVWEVQLDPATFQVIGTPLVVFRGRMDQLDIALGAQASVTCRLENRLAGVIPQMAAFGSCPPPRKRKSSGRRGASRDDPHNPPARLAGKAGRFHRSAARHAV
jgi:hypothetical protein